MNFIKKGTNNSSSCCGVEIKEVKEQESTNAQDSCCGSSSGSNDSCCG